MFWAAIVAVVFVVTEYLVLVNAMARNATISIWFFIGLLILVYGVLILGAGIAGLSSPPPVVMAELHVAIWWGAFLIVIGAVYVYLFRPASKPMSVVAGVDFGTLSVRVSIVDSNCGRIGSGVAEYPLHRRTQGSRLRHAKPHRSHGRARRSHTARSGCRRSGRRRPSVPSLWIRPDRA